MSLINVSLPFLSLKPGIKTQYGKVTVTNSALIKLFTLGLNTYDIEISSLLKRIRFEKRYFYIFTASYEVYFKELYYIEYEYYDIPTSFGFNMSARDSVENFKVSLVDKNGKKHFIGNFAGEGSVMNGWEGVLWGDSKVDFSGNQESESLGFVEMLEKILKIPVGKPIPGEKLYKKL